MYNTTVNNIINNKYVKEDTLITIIDNELKNINENIKDEIRNILLSELTINISNTNEKK